MMKSFIVIFCFGFTLGLSAQDVSRTIYFPKVVEKPAVLPDRNKVWIFIMAGQSNMAGRGFVEPQDTVAQPRILAIDKSGQLILAKEPLNLNEPSMVGLDCGSSFARQLLKSCPSDVSILILHTAVGGSSIQKWINDSIHREVPLLTNFRKRVEQAKSFGIVKGIIWHQGESDANEKGISLYLNHLDILFTKFREICGDSRLPIAMGELGYFSKTAHASFMAINAVMHQYADTDPRTVVVSTKGLDHKGDFLHFNSEGQRKLGVRYAKGLLKKFSFDNP